MELTLGLRSSVDASSSLDRRRHGFCHATSAACRAGLAASGPWRPTQACAARVGCLCHRSRARDPSQRSESSSSPNSRIAAPPICRSTGPSAQKTCFPSTARTPSRVWRDGSTAPLSCAEASLDANRTGPPRQQRGCPRRRRSASAKREHRDGPSPIEVPGRWPGRAESSRRMEPWNDASTSHASGRGRGDAR